MNKINVFVDHDGSSRVTINGARVDNVEEFSVNAVKGKSSVVTIRLTAEVKLKGKVEVKAEPKPPVVAKPEVAVAPVAKVESRGSADELKLVPNPRVSAGLGK